MDTTRISMAMRKENRASGSIAGDKHTQGQVYVAVL